MEGMCFRLLEVRVQHRTTHPVGAQQRRGQRARPRCVQRGQRIESGLAKTTESSLAQRRRRARFFERGGAARRRRGGALPSRVGCTMSITALVDELERLVLVHDAVSADLGARLVTLGQHIQRRPAVAHLEMLPDTLVAHMLSFLRAPEMSIASQTCRRMRTLLADAVSSRAAALNLPSMASSVVALHHAEVLKRVGTFKGPSTFAPPERAATLSLRHYSFVYEFALSDGEPLRVLSFDNSTILVCPPFAPSADFNDAQNAELRRMLESGDPHLAVRCFVHKTSTDEIQCIYNGIIEESWQPDGHFDDFEEGVGAINPSLTTQFYTSDDEVSEMIRARLSTDLFDLGTHHPFEGNVPQKVSLKCEGWIAGTEPAGPTGSSTDRPGVSLTIQRGVFDEPEVLGPEALQELLMYYFKA